MLENENLFTTGVILSFAVSDGTGVDVLALMKRISALQSSGQNCYKQQEIEEQDRSSCSRTWTWYRQSGTS
ncbi:hypothetical protein F2Q70_00027905 [Brassica cretica]|uniref:Uncharacterized protein n=1 Tax=Brassica cretica TaxID=69181 RepID=A0A8S9IIS9_BRACR|nr:hypothetical protein F2Q68_00027488 [Brassica cretica]KAF2601887.1 hypothetical protein F2Q70_00027905 [Brassica cretica]